MKKLAVWKFTSCDGCQLSLLDLEDELLMLTESLEFAWFLEASSAVRPGPYDISLVEGSITTPDDETRILEVRRQSRFLVTIGACATSGGIQALRNFADIKEFLTCVYARPDYIKTLAHSLPISAYVPVDFELQGCPIDKNQLLEVITSFLLGKRPALSNESVCCECKRKGLVCVWVAEGRPCLGPVTHAGCGALCPSYSRGCYGCFGPKENANVPSLAGKFREEGQSPRDIQRLLRTFQVAAPAFSGRSDEPSGS
jgi:coenzyme F420-reducing hydrogenase gamma subunit